MNVVASTSAHFGHSRLAVSPEMARHWPSLDMAGKGRLLALRTACEMYFLTNCETIDEL